jgi:hypothetical protein
MLPTSFALLLDVLFVYRPNLALAGDHRHYPSYLSLDAIKEDGK